MSEEYPQDVEKKKGNLCKRLRELKAANPEKYKRLVEACREYDALRQRYNTDPAYRQNPNNLVELHQAFYKVRQGIIFSDTLDGLDSGYGKDIINELTDIILEKD